jgi:hypothetical protein
VTKNEDEFDDEEAEEEQDEIEEPQPESGPPLLASVNEDDGWYYCVLCSFDEVGKTGSRRGGNFDVSSEGPSLGS